MLRNAVEDSDSRSAQHDSHVFNEWVKEARGWLMYVAAYRFVNSYNEIMGGSYENDLFHETNHVLSIEVLRRAMSQFVYNSRGILTLELSTQTILNSLLDRFIPAVIYYDDESGTNKPSNADRKYIDLISESCKLDYHNEKLKNDSSYNLYLRLLMVIDFIAGMTDSYAKTLYLELNGMK